MITLAAVLETWPIAGRFAISRGARTEAVVVVAEIRDGEHRGRGEAVPYGRYGETPEGVRDLILAQESAIREGATRTDLIRRMPAGAARNALDCALWDLEAKRSGRRVWELAELPPPRPLVTAYTLSLDSPEAMRRAAEAATNRPLLKVKLGGAGDEERIKAVREGAPGAKLIVDANEAWDETNCERLIGACAEAGVALIEQPLRAGRDDMLARIPRAVPICADESLHDLGTLASVLGKYDVVNIKLDKTGGLTEALALSRAARAADLGIMVGCMVGTSLAMAPAALLAQDALVVDLDGPLLLARDREPGLVFEGSLMHPPEPALWG